MTKAEAKQIELLRAAGPEARSELALRLSDQVLTLARHAIDDAFSHLDGDERRVKFVEVHYGRALAKRIAEHFRTRRPV